MSDTIRPFYCGAQYGDWQGANCHRCAKDYDEEAGAFRCAIQQAIDVAYIGDGTVPQEIADRMGHTKAHENDQHPYQWMCSEVEWTEEWKAECARRKAAAALAPKEDA